MIEYIETRTADGTPIRIEVESAAKSGAGFARQTAPTDVSTEGTKGAYDQVLATIRACANGVVDTLQNLSAAPNAASIDFAIKINAEAGAVIAKSMADSHFKVSLTWKQVEPESESPAGEAD
jgi:hypothetical protein